MSQFSRIHSRLYAHGCSMIMHEWCVNHKNNIITYWILLSTEERIRSHLFLYWEDHTLMRTEIRCAIDCTAKTWMMHTCYGSKNRQTPESNARTETGIAKRVKETH